MPLVRAARTASFATLLFGAACSSNDLTAPIADADLPGALMAPATTLINPVISTGSFYSYTANNNGEEYWDNPSNDGVKCNVGYFAENDLGTCADAVGAPDLSNEFVGSTFLAGADRAKPVPFAMAAGRYSVRFLGGYRGYKNEPFGFAYDNKSKFLGLSSIISGQVGSEALVTFGSAFSFYVTPLYPINTGDNCGTSGAGASNCSDDATLQQFALFKKGDAYLLGVEDKPGVVIGTYTFPGVRSDDDRDYNDFFLRIDAGPPSELLGGRMTGGLSAMVGGEKVQVSLTIHCDNRLSNNLSVSWGDVRFQMDKNAISPLICSNTPVFSPQNPATNINVFSGTATGFVGTTPATLEFTLRDNGETRTADPDQMDLMLTINSNAPRSTGGPLNATGGNIQTHYDQPHRSK